MPAPFTRPKKVSKRGIAGDGRPSKQTPEVVAQIAHAISMGLNDAEAASLVGISDVTLTMWKRDPNFMGQIQYAVSQRLLQRLSRIERGELGWQGTSWVLERLYPARFARPEIQLGVQINTQEKVNTTLVISVEEAQRYEERSRVVTEEIDKLLEARAARFKERDKQPDNPAPPARVVEAELVEPGPITLPPESERDTGWWKQLSRGDGKRAISAEAFMYALQTVVVRLRGLPAASALEVDLGEGQLFLRDLHDTIQELTGPGAGKF